MIKVRKSKRECTEVGAKPVPVKTHLRNCIITPEMVGSVIAIHTGKVFSNVEIKVLFKIINLKSLFI
jgi:small subunit ribosomal protein S15e